MSDPGTPFTPEEDASVVSLREEGWSFGRIGEKLARHQESCRKRYYKLRPDRVPVPKGAPWTPEEDAVLLKHANGALRDIRRLLPLRTANSIRNRFHLLGIDRCYLRMREYGGTGCGTSGVYWTPDEDKILKDNQHLTNAEISALIPGRTTKSVGARRSKLNLPPPGAGQTAPAFIERPFGVPYQTSSGAMAIRLGCGIVPYIPTLYADLAR